MDIVKVFGNNLKNIAQHKTYHKKHSPKSVVCTALILAQSSVIAAVFLWKTFNA